MLPIQGTIHFSEYSSLYDVVVPKDNKLRLRPTLLGQPR